MRFNKYIIYIVDSTQKVTVFRYELESQAMKKAEEMAILGYIAYTGILTNKVSLPNVPIAEVTKL